MDSQEDILKDDEKANLGKKLLAEACEKEGLDDKHLPKLSEILGVKSKEALKHVQYEDYLKLEPKVRPWGKRALQKLLEVTVNKGDAGKTFEEVQKKHLETVKQRQEAAKLLLKELKEMHNSHSHSKGIREKEEALWQAIEIPKYWPPLEKSLVGLLENIQKQLEHQELTVSKTESISDMEVLRQVSGGLALRGIYKTSSFADVLAKRDQPIQVPDGFRLAGPEQGSLFERKEFSSSAAEAAFTKSMEKLGFSITISAKAGFWGLNVDTVIDYSSSSQSKETHQSRSEQSYICTTKYHYMPLASCYFQKHQLRLTDVALQELQAIEHLLSSTQEEDRSNMLKSRCKSFFSMFGSHVNQGPLHFGGIFWWKASIEGFRAEQREEMKQQASESLDGYVRAAFSSFGVSMGVDVEGSKYSSHASSQGRDGRRAHTEIQHYVTNTGCPPETNFLPQWKGLVTNNTTWCVIDQGFQLIPVWDIILLNQSDFKSSCQMSSILRAAYEALTNHSVSIMFGEELVSAVEEARASMECVKAWEVTVDEDKLSTLIKFKQNLSEKTKTHNVWINICLSEKGLQEFLVNTVLFCKKSPPENTMCIKSLLKCLLDPYVYSVKDFPRSSFIMQWIFDSKHMLPEALSVSELEDLTTTLLQMKEYIQEVTYAPETATSAIHEAKVKATLTISSTVYYLLQVLRGRAQKDIEQVDIDREIEDVLLDHFKERNLLARIREFPKTKAFSADLEKHIAKKKRWHFFVQNFDHADVGNIQHITNNIIMRVMENTGKKEQEKRDYSQSFIHEILNEVQKGISSVPSNAKYSFNTDYAIDLSLYLCRMASERFKGLHETFRKANDPAIYLANKREDFFKYFQFSCQGATSITTFAVFLCAKIVPALRQAIYERTALTIAQDIRVKLPDFSGNRSSLEAFILKYQAEKENFEYFQEYLNFSGDFMKSYIERRVETYCLDKNRRLEKFLDDSLTHLYENILSAVFQSTKTVKDRRDRNDKISLWLDEFCKALREVLIFPRSNLRSIEHQEIKDIDFLKNAMTEALASLKDSLKEEFPDADMRVFKKQPHAILAEQFSGCWNQCPFCGAVCTNTVPHHDGDHQLVFHRPQVLAGYRWYKTDNLVIDICSGSIVSSNSFRIDENTWIPYKKYRDAVFKARLDRALKDMI
ncbi:LOW QUALITY PROTEIN: interferon-induced very large GTPase 1-like [Ara ararauna]